MGEKCPASAQVGEPNIFGNLDNIAEVDIQYPVGSLGDELFQGDETHSLASVKLPEGLQHIGKRCFYRCVKLPEITIPSTVVAIDAQAFLDCRNLETITIKRAENSVSGAPWGAPDSTNIVWTG